MVDPIQYSAVNPMQSFAQGYDLGNAMRAQQAQAMQQQQAMEQAQRQQDVMSGLMQKIQSGTVKPSDYEAATIALPGMREQMKQAFEMHSSDTKQAITSEMSQVYSALASNRPDLAKQVLQRRVDSMTNSGAPSGEIQQVQAMLDNIDQNPDFVRLNTGMMLGAIGEKDAFAGTEEQRAQAGEQRKAELHPGELKKQEGEILQQALQRGLTKAQTNEAMVRTRNLGIEGQKAALELKAIQSGKANPYTGKPPTEDEKKSAGYAIRLQNNLNLINGIVEKNPSAKQASILRTGLGKLPFFGEGLSASLASNDRERIEAAQLDMLDAALTLNTGAAYTKEQLEGLRKSYFPTPLDNEETIKDKADRVQSLIDTAMVRAGQAAPMAQSLMTPAGAPKQSAPLQASQVPGGLPDGWTVKER